MKETIAAITTIADAKIKMMKQRPINYLMQAMFGGHIIGFGILLIVTIGGIFDPLGVPSMKVVQGLAFGVALSMVMMAGANLFTGDNLVLTISTLEKKSTPLEMISIWIFSYLGNFFGSLFAARRCFVLLCRTCHWRYGCLYREDGNSQDDCRICGAFMPRYFM
ncbi:formate/nitrite transporter family protein [Lysinibacillus sphaericus]|uniref:formate/nitrite transporter family protein n=1 Tax=Lysinibacillus sphaericus TaxID=1421 RepID=UPI003CFDFC46